MKEKQEHFHSIRIISTLKGKKAYCIQPRCNYAGAPELLHRKLVECEVCFSHFLFDYDAYVPKPGENRILCWQCAGAPRIQMTLEQEQVLLERIVREENLTTLAELESDCNKRKSEVEAHERALLLFEKGLSEKQLALQTREDRISERRKFVFEIIKSAKLERASLRLEKKKLKGVEVPKEPKAPKLSKAEKLDKKLEEEIKEKQKKELEDVIFAAITGAIAPAIEGSEEQSTTNNGTVG